MHRDWCDMGPLGGLGDALQSHPFLFCLPIYRLVSLWCPGATPLPTHKDLGVHSSVLPSAFFSFSLNTCSCVFPLRALAIVAGGPFICHSWLPAAFPPNAFWHQQIPGSLRSSSFAGCSSSEFFYVSGFGRAGCFCFSISCPLSLKVQSQGSSTASLRTSLPFLCWLETNH